MTSLRAALMELDTLRKRDVLLRQETELVLKVVTVLANAPDGHGLVQSILDTILQGFRYPQMLLLERSGEADAKIMFSNMDNAAEQLNTSAFTQVDYLRKPGLVFDVQKLPNWPNIVGPDGSVFRTALMAPLIMKDRWFGLFLLRDQSQEPFTTSDFRVFKRLLPMLHEATIREQNSTERMRMEVELRHMQKLEGLGTLAGGIAHEINTPMQYVINNVSFLADGFNDMADVVRQLRDSLPSDSKDHLETALDSVDYGYIADEMPIAIGQTRDGLAQISKIVQAIKEFSHAGTGEREPQNINGLIDSALTISRNQWKYVSEAETDLDPTLPDVPCFVEGVRQVLLNLIVNAAQAIEDGRQGNELGLISLRTYHTLDYVYLEVKDTGVGVSEEVKTRIFDPFFTTKAPGRGTGQGLSVCYSIVVQQHGGKIEVDSVEGEGSTFRIMFPMALRHPGLVSDATAALTKQTV